MDDTLALYIHIPFCLRRCNYCSFVSYEGRQTDIPAYVEALKREIEISAVGQQVGSIYFGGGTPSLLSVDQLDDLLKTIHSRFDVDTSAEMTMEANPGTVDSTYLSAVRSLGVNRISIGVQSLDDKELALLGRIHTSQEAKQIVELARKAGFDNINLDLIYGIPGRTIDQWKRMLVEIADLHPQHLSLYGLTLEGDEPLSLSIKRGDVQALDSDKTADQYELAEDILKSRGYSHYEISNWALDGQQCKHNLVYWQGTPYLGIGVAAHSYINGCRFANTSNLDSYLAASMDGSLPARDMEEEIGRETALAEAVILGLRLSRGVDARDIKSRFSVDLLDRYGSQVKELTGLGLLISDKRSIKLTSRGRLLGNEVFWRFLP